MHYFLKLKAFVPCNPAFVTCFWGVINFALTPAADRKGIAIEMRCGKPFILVWMGPKRNSCRQNVEGGFLGSWPYLKFLFFSSLVTSQWCWFSTASLQPLSIYTHELQQLLHVISQGRILDGDNNGTCLHNVLQHSHLPKLGECETGRIFQRLIGRKTENCHPVAESTCTITIMAGSTFLTRRNP